MLAFCLLSPFHAIQDSAHEMVLPTVADVPTSIKIIRAVLQRHAQRPFSQVTLGDSVKSTTPKHFTQDFN